MQIIGPALNERSQCEEVLRSSTRWFGIEDALLMYADDSVRAESRNAGSGCGQALMAKLGALPALALLGRVALRPAAY